MASEQVCKHCGKDMYWSVTGFRNVARPHSAFCNESYQQHEPAELSTPAAEPPGFQNVIHELVEMCQRTRVLDQDADFFRTILRRWNLPTGERGNQPQEGVMTTEGRLANSPDPATPPTGVEASASVGAYRSFTFNANDGYRIDDKTVSRDEWWDAMYPSKEKQIATLQAERDRLRDELNEAKVTAKREMIDRLNNWIGRVGHEDYYKSRAKLLEFEQRAEAAEFQLAEARKALEAVAALDPRTYPKDGLLFPNEPDIFAFTRGSSIHAKVLAVLSQPTNPPAAPSDLEIKLMAALKQLDDYRKLGNVAAVPSEEEVDEVGHKFEPQTSTPETPNH